MVRCFEDTDVTHVEGRIDPIADIETVETELMLADLDSLERRVDGSKQEGARAATRKPRRKEALDLVNRALALLRDGKPARLAERKPEEEKPFHMLGLLTSQPVLYVCNVEEGVGRDRQRVLAARSKRARKAEGAGCGRHLGQDRSRRSRCCRATSAPIISTPSA